MTTYYYTVVMIIIELLVNTRNGAIHQFLEREGWINDATWDNQTGIGSGRMEGWLSYHMMVDQEEKTFGSVASLATGLTSAPTDMLYCFSGFVVLTQIFDVINFFSKWVSTINRQRHITNITCRYTSWFRKGKLGLYQVGSFWYHIYIFISMTIILALIHLSDRMTE